MDADTLLYGVIPIVAVLHFVALPAAWELSRRIALALQERHTEVWSELERPFDGPWTPRQNRLLTRFIRERRYEALGDEELTRYARWALRLDEFVLVIHSMAFAAFLAIAILNASSR